MASLPCNRIGLLALISNWPTANFESFYQLDKPSAEDRSMFFDRLIEVALSIQSEEMRRKLEKLDTLVELPKAPKVDIRPKASELKAKAEAEQHALRRLRMCLRDICNRILYDKRFSAFHYPVSEEDAPNYRTIIQNPMDIATLLQRVDSGKYVICQAFLEDFDLILVNAKIYNGDDYNGSRIVSRAHELRDAVHGMLSQMDPALVAFCEKIAAEGGPMPVPDELAGSSFPTTTVVQLASVTRASARLRNVQPDVNLDQSYEALKRPKKNFDAAHAGTAVEGGPSEPPNSSQEPEVDDTDPHRPGISFTDDPQLETCEKDTSEDVVMSDSEISEKIVSVKSILMERTDGYGVPQLERLYTRVMKGVFETKASEPGYDLRPAIFSYLLKFAENGTNF
ncbi:hypothetical protein RHGRI_025711 [Rhododendron griersonianum]|uniref:Bromo domain-containing protein n=1 Tax=Rhododendron griersonianum TaxID=479676 RepID=A0AAV6ITK5_9ERIC|nr:hypothetical protein RHGRI_025711 [Rhododendron griersonianum]